MNFRKIKGYENYSISNTGVVKNDTTGKVLRWQNNSQGYPRVMLKDKKWSFVHHLVAYTWIGERPLGKVLDHIDNNKENPSVSNLRYITQSVNVKKGWETTRRALCV